MPDAPGHKVFISYYHKNDQEYKNRLVQALVSRSVDMAVREGDIQEEGLHIDEIRRRIRDDHIADATVTIVLIGPCTWKRKQADWEISASLIDRPSNPRCGSIGLLLPTHPDYRKSPEHRNPRLKPPRLARNIEGDDPFAVVYDWPASGVAQELLPKIHNAFLRRKKSPWPDDSLELFAKNHRGPRNKGWQN